MRTFYLVLLALGLLWSAPSWAADGDRVSGDSSCKIGNSSLSPYNDCESYKLCDGKTANGACAEIELGTSGKSLASSAQFSIENITTCTGTPTVNILAANTSRTCTTGSSVCHTLATIDGTTSSAFVGAGEDPIPRFITGEITGLVACTDFEVWMTLYYKND